MKDWSNRLELVLDIKLNENGEYVNNVRYLEEYCFHCGGSGHLDEINDSFHNDNDCPKCQGEGAWYWPNPDFGKKVIRVTGNKPK